MKRRTAVTGIAAALALALPHEARALDSDLAALEARYGGRLGIAAVDLGTGRRIVHRANERFPMCSTFKVLAVGAVLQRVERGHERLQRSIAYSAHDLLAYAPITKAHLGPDGRGRMTLEALCAAAIEWSDNTAANLLLGTIGGPPGVTAFARRLGDGVTRLDRTEPSLNEAIPGDPRDTTTPAAMLADVRVLLGGARLGAQTAHLRGWMLRCRTSDARIPAGLPRGWRSGNKTGSGDDATTNDVAVLFPPQGAPKVVAAYYTGAHASNDQRDATLAAVGRLVARRFA